MHIQFTSPKTKICAMCVHWNGPRGGDFVKPRSNMKNIMEYYSQESKICYKNHFEKMAWNTCTNWIQRY